MKQYMLWGWRSHLKHPLPIRITGGSKTHCLEQRRKYYNKRLGWTTGLFEEGEQPKWLIDRILQITKGINDEKQAQQQIPHKPTQSRS